MALAERFWNRPRWGNRQMAPGLLAHNLPAYMHTPNIIPFFAFFKIHNVHTTRIHYSPYVMDAYPEYVSSVSAATQVGPSHWVLRKALCLWHIRIRCSRISYRRYQPESDCVVYDFCASILSGVPMVQHLAENLDMQSTKWSDLLGRNQVFLLNILITDGK